MSIQSHAGELQDVIDDLRVVLERLGAVTIMMSRRIAIRAEERAGS